MTDPSIAPQMTAGWLKPIPAVLFVATLALYLAFPTKDFYWDGVGFAMVIDHPERFGMILPNHPIYIGLGFLLHYLAQWILPGVTGLQVLQAMDSVAGTVAVVLVYAIAKELLDDAVDAVLLAALFALSGTWWKFATDADAYIPSVMMLLIAARLLLPGRPAKPLTVAILHVAAMLLHELAVMFVIPSVTAIYLQSLPNRRRAITNIATYLSTAFILATAGYYASFHLATGQSSLAQYVAWITYHTPGSDFSFNPAHDAWMTVRGTLRLVTGGRVGAFHASTLDLAAVLALAALGTALLWRFGSHRDSQATPVSVESGKGVLSRQAIVFLGVWMTAYIGFLLFWLPENTFYRVFYLPPLILLAGYGFKKVGGRWLVYGVLVLLGAWNFLFFMLPHSRVESNPVLSAGLAMRPFWKPGTFVYQGSFIPDNWTIFCFNPQVRFKDLNPSQLNVTDTELKTFADRGEQTWIDSSGIDLLESSAEGRDWLAAHTRPGFRHDLSDLKHKLRFDRLFP